MPRARGTKRLSAEALHAEPSEGRGLRRGSDQQRSEISFGPISEARHRQGQFSFTGDEVKGFVS